MTTTTKSYKHRFGNFKAGVCPYCSARGAILTPKANGRFVGKCIVCRATNNFTNPACITWNEEL